MNKIVGYKYSSYLIGAMSVTAEKDGGVASRVEVEKELLMRNVFPINPAKLEAAKTGISAARGRTGKIRHAEKCESRGCACCLKI